MSGAAFAQSITDGSYRTIGFIKSDGTIQDAHYKTIGFIKSDGTVQDGSYRTIGRLRSDGSVQDASYRTLGFIKNDGTVQDRSYRTIGFVKSDGTVQDSSYRTIGHARGVPMKWAAFYFFFLKWLFTARMRPCRFKKKQYICIKWFYGFAAHWADEILVSLQFYIVASTCARQRSIPLIRECHLWFDLKIENSSEVSLVG